MKRYKSIALYMIVVLVLSCGIYSSNLLSYTVNADGELQHSTIGGIDVGSLQGDKLRAVLQQSITSWESEPLVISGGGATLTLDSADLEYDLDATIDLYETMTKKPWYAFWKPKRIVQLPLQVVENEQFKQAIEAVTVWATDATYYNVMQAGAYLASHAIDAVVSESAELAHERIALAIEPIPSAARGWERLAAALNEQTIGPEESFSLIETLGQEVKLANDEALNFVASMVYSIALNTNSEIIERSSQRQVPDYLQAGVEAAVEQDGSQDLKFKNRLSQAITLKTAIEGDKLKLEAYAPESVQTVNIHVAVDYEVAPRIITRYSRELPVHRQLVLREGKDGVRVSVYRLDTATNTEERISRDYYPPMHRIVLQSSLTAVHSAEAVMPQYNESASYDEEMISSGEGIFETESLVYDQVVIGGTAVDIWDGTTDIIEEEQDNGK